MKMGIYREDGGRANVKVLVDKSTDERHEYTLQITSIVRQPSIGQEWTVGQVFNCFQLKNAGAWGGMWSLDIDDSDTEVES